MVITPPPPTSAAPWKTWPPTSACAAVLLRAGVAADRISVTGFPVSPAFHEERATEIDPSIGSGDRRILYLGNMGGRKIERTLEELLELPKVRLTVTVGRDSELKARLHQRLEPFGDRVRLYGWTNLMPRLLLTHPNILPASPARPLLGDFHTPTNYSTRWSFPFGRGRLHREIGCGMGVNLHRLGRQIPRRFDRNRQRLRRAVAVLSVHRAPAGAPNLEPRSAANEPRHSRPTPGASATE